MVVLHIPKCLVVMVAVLRYTLKNIPFLNTGVRFVREIVNGNTSSTRDSILELDLSRTLVYDALYELMLSH
ncbi:MAG TPA: hypothetical protein VH481_09985 [Nitrososphaeraceae archaeon]